MGFYAECLRRRRLSDTIAMSQHRKMRLRDRLGQKFAGRWAKRQIAFCYAADGQTGHSGEDRQGTRATAELGTAS
jgi:hypothetical protein